MTTWPSAHNTALVVEDLEAGDKTVQLWVARDGDGSSCRLTPTAARQVAAKIAAQANVIDPLPKQSAGPVTVFRGAPRADARFEAELINGELNLRIYPNQTGAHYAVVVPIEDVRSVLSEIRDVAFPDEKCPF